MWTIVDQVNVKGPAWSRRTKVKGPDHRASGVKLQLFAVLGVSLHFGKSFGTAFWQEPWQEPLAHFGKSFGKNLLARSRKQSAQRAMPPQQQHTKSQGQRRESAALCGIACVSLHFGKSFGKNIWQDHVSRAHSEPCRRNNSTRSHSASGVHLRLFAVYVRVTALLAAFNNAAATDTRHAVRGPGRNHAAVARCLHNS
jgi:hypothetical protein